MNSSSTSTNFDVLTNCLCYKFNDPRLLELAITHSSWANESSMHEHNERLEWLGDAVLELCISAELYQRFSDAREGDLTLMRSRLVNENSLADIARAIGLQDIIKVGAGEEKQGGRERESILSDALEAILGAIYLDGGLTAAQEVIKRLFASKWPDTWRVDLVLDCKSRLQTLSQQLFHAFPVYNLNSSSGPDHAKTFEVCLHLPNGAEYIASSSSCKKAEQKAAKMALDDLTITIA